MFEDLLGNIENLQSNRVNSSCILIAPSVEVGNNLIHSYLTKQRGDVALFDLEIKTSYMVAKDIFFETYDLDKDIELMSREQTINEIYEYLLSSECNIIDKNKVNREISKCLYDSIFEYRQSLATNLLDNPRHQIIKNTMEHLLKVKGGTTFDEIDLIEYAIKRSDLASEKSSKYITLSCFNFTKLEKKLIDSLASNLQIIDVVQPVGSANCNSRLKNNNEEVELRNNGSTLVACRTMLSQNRFVVSDIIDKNHNFDECVIVALSRQDAYSILHYLNMLKIPVTSSFGLSATTSKFFTFLNNLYSWKDNHYRADLLKEMMIADLIVLDKKAEFIDRLDSQNINVGWGKSRLLSRFLDYFDKHVPEVDGNIKKTWKSYLDLLFNICESKGSLDEQKQNLLNILDTYCKKTGLYRGEYKKVTYVIESISFLAPEETLLGRTIEELKCVSIHSESPKPSAIHIAHLESSYAMSRKHVYVIGASRFSLQSNIATNPFLLDHERQELGIASSQDIEFENLYFLKNLILQNDGKITFTYSNLDVSRMIKLLPQPFISDFVGENIKDVNLKNEKMYLKSDFASNNIRFPSNSVELSENISSVEQTNYVDFISNFTYSPSALEKAIECPLSFYISYYLKINERQPYKFSSTSWLNAADLGRAVHKILEVYYRGKRDIDQIINDIIEECKEEVPYFNNDLVKQEKDNISKYIYNAIKWTEEHDLVPEYEEMRFGYDDKPCTIEVCGEQVRVKGTIDRVDATKGEDSINYSILDYKTGKTKPYEFLIKNSKNPKYKKVQSLIYAKAFEELMGKRIKQAGYLFLQSDDYIGISRTDDKMISLEHATKSILDWLKDEEKAQVASPLFEFNEEGFFFDIGEKEKRQKEVSGDYSKCHYCDYFEMCDFARIGIEKAISD